MNKKCQVFTPSDYVEKLISCIDYTNPYGKKILENSCGIGNILMMVVRKYIIICRKLKFSKDKISFGLSNDIYGIEIDPDAYAKCIDNLNAILEEWKLPPVNWKIFNINFFNWESDIKFSYIIGNPPYITYGEIPLKERIFLKKTYQSCMKGKFDYCYAFIEKSIKLLGDDGKFAYLVPCSIFKTVFGYNLRKMILQHLKEVYDFSDYQIFNEVLVKSSIFVYDKIYNKGYFYYKNSKHEKKINKSGIKDKLCFNVEKTKKMMKFGDFFFVSHGVATLCNTAFVLDDYEEEDGFVLSKGIYFENDCIREAVSPRGMHYNNMEKIIFPYYYEDDILKHYSEDEFKALFPNTYLYLVNNKKKLSQRKKDSNALWFEYGRSQALSKINKRKLLISTIVTDDVKVYKISKNAVPYSGLHILRKSNLSLDLAKRILETKQFMDYVKNIGIPITGHSIRITSKDIMNYKFDMRDL